MTRMLITTEMFITCRLMGVILVTAAPGTPLHDAFFGTSHNIFMNAIRFTFLMTRMRITTEMFITCLFMEVIFVTAASGTPLHDAFFGTISFMES